MDSKYNNIHICIFETSCNHVPILNMRLIIDDFYKWIHVLYDTLFGLFFPLLVSLNHWLNFIYGAGRKLFQEDVPAYGGYPGGGGYTPWN